MAAIGGGNVDDAMMTMMKGRQRCKKNEGGRMKQDDLDLAR